MDPRKEVTEFSPDKILDCNTYQRLTSVNTTSYRGPNTDPYQKLTNSTSANNTPYSGAKKLKSQLQHQNNDSQMTADTFFKKRDLVQKIDTEILSLFPFMCGLCFKKFDNIFAYYNHLSTHEGLDVYLHSCEVTDSFAEAASGDTFTCGLCKLTFPSLCSLYRHLIQVECVSDFMYHSFNRTAQPLPDLQNVSTHSEDITDFEMSKSLDESDQDVPVLHTLDTSAALSKHKIPLVHTLKTSEAMENHTVPVFKNIDVITESEINPRGHLLLKKIVTDSKGVECDLQICSQRSNVKHKGEIIAKNTREFVKLGTEIENNVIDKKDTLKCKPNVHLLGDNSENENTNNIGDNDQAKQTVNTATKKKHLRGLEGEDDMNINCSGKDDGVSNKGNQEEYQPVISSLVELTKTQKRKGIAKRRMSPNHTPKQVYLDEDGNQIPARDSQDQCETCGFITKRKYMSNHKVIHIEARAFSCDECGFKFRAANHVTEHKRIVHARENNFTCDQCGKGFKAFAYLKQHSDTHKTIRDRQCPICPRKFTTRAILAAHVVTHEDTKPHQCDQCGRAFRRAGQLTMHNKSYHVDEKTFPCAQCSKMFKTKKDALKHEQIHMPHKHFCQFCSKSFVTASNMRIHLKVHSK